MASRRAQEQEVLRHLRAFTEGGDAAMSVDSAQLSHELEALFSANQDRVYGLCYRIVGDPERASELAQEALLRAWSKLPEFRGESAFSTWLYSIARNLCFHAIHKRAELLTHDGILDPGSNEASAAKQLRRHEREALIRKASETLEPIEQEAVWLRYVEGLSQDQITDILGLEQASGARGLLQTCRRKLSRETHRLLTEMGHGTSFLRTRG